ncbi:MAG: peptidyl-prolyl cis-trans isomerase [Alphaproteobacteria bacterium]|nr:peptidyl-prolyl cis-trans isomerase [Alphaproteobacteria bacterium]
MASQSNPEALENTKHEIGTAVSSVTVNDVAITPEQINAEVQYHPAESLQAAKYKAVQSLVIRELLTQRAIGLGFCDRDEVLESTDGIFETLFETEIQTPEADEATCKHFYQNNKQRFYTSPLFEASHILYLAPEGDEDARQSALKKAQNALQRITEKPDDFATIAKAESACSSAKTGGHLEQITKGQTTPAFEQALFNMQEEEISKQPLGSEFGYHIIKVHKRLEGKQLPFEAVHEWIVDYLGRQSWQRAFSQYIQLLAGSANISGFQLKSADSPLVQ